MANITNTIEAVCARIEVLHKYNANRITFGEAKKLLMALNLTEYEAISYLKQ